MMPNRSSCANRSKGFRETSGTELLNLPFDVLRYIHDRLALVDYMSFRSVSKLCRKVAPALEFKTAIIRSEIQSNLLSPWLITFHANRRICRFNHPQCVDRYSVELPEARQGATDWYCKDGWLLIGKQRGDNYFLSFFNPFTKNVISYPIFPKKFPSSACICFSCPPTSHSCVVVVLVPSYTLDLYICISREKGWRFFQFRFPNFFPKKYPVFANGAFFFGSCYHNIGVLSLQGEGCDWKFLDHPQEYWPDNYDSFLAERDGEVFTVFIYEQKNLLNVRVHKLNPCTMSWKRVENLGNYNLHISPKNAIFSVAKTTEAENKIYFPSFLGNGLLSYSLTTSSLQYMDIDKIFEHAMWYFPWGWIKL